LRASGAAAPATSGTSDRPINASSPPALRVVVAMPMLPATVVRPNTSNAGEESAYRMATASSMPGSVSITARIFAILAPLQRPPLS